MFQPAGQFLPMIDKVCKCLVRNCLLGVLESCSNLSVSLVIQHSDFLMFEQVFRSLVEITKDIIGATVENNKFCVSVHYRNVDEKVWLFTKQTLFDFLFRLVLFTYLEGILFADLFTLLLELYLNFYIQNWNVVAQCVNDVLKDYPSLRLTHGRKVFFRANIQPDQVLFIFSLNIFCSCQADLYAFNFC